MDGMPEVVMVLDHSLFTKVFNGRIFDANQNGFKVGDLSLSNTHLGMMVNFYAEK